MPPDQGPGLVLTSFAMSARTQPHQSSFYATDRKCSPYQLSIAVSGKLSQLGQLLDRSMAQITTAVVLD